MKCVIFLYFVYAIWIILIKANIPEESHSYSRDDCIDCCNGIQLDQVIACKTSCDERFNKSLKFHSIKACLSSCEVIHEACREPCRQDCRITQKGKNKPYNDQRSEKRKRMREEKSEKPIRYQPPVTNKKRKKE